jgi:hypothetical protein
MDERNNENNGGSSWFVIIVAILAFWMLWVFLWTPHASAATYDYDISANAIPVTMADVGNPDIQSILKSKPCWVIKQEIGMLKEKEPVPERTEYFDLPLDHDLQNHIFELCEEYKIDPRIAFAVIYQESRCTADIVGDSGRSFGLMQIQIKWHKGRMEKLGCTDLLDPYQNVEVGIDFLAELYTYGGRRRSTEWVLMAYNGCPGSANEKTAAGELTGYAKSVLSIAKRLEVVANAA